MAILKTNCVRVFYTSLNFHEYLFDKWQIFWKVPLIDVLHIDKLRRIRFLH